MLLTILCSTTISINIIFEKFKTNGISYNSLRRPRIKERVEEIEASYEGLKQLIANMFETMYNAKGVGLAAPQIGLSIRLFIVDGSPLLKMMVLKKTLKAKTLTSESFYKSNYRK